MPMTNAVALLTKGRRQASAQAKKTKSEYFCFKVVIHKMAYPFPRFAFI